MTHLIHPRKTSGAGRTLLWVVVLLTLALLLWVTIFAAQHNPYQSYAVYNGVSKFRFVADCKDQVQAQLDKAPSKLNFHMADSPQQYLSEVTQAPGGGWQWVSNIVIGAAGQPGNQTLPFACAYDKKTDKTQLLGIGNPNQSQPTQP